MPYWRRQRALRANVENYSHLYQKDDVELIIVDDGSPVPTNIDDINAPWSIDVVRLPRKSEALNPCVPFNVGVKASHGKYIVLTNPEVVHREPILVQMCEQLDAIGPHGYVAAACRGRKVWYCHSELMPPDEVMGRAPSPPGAGLHFCAMMRRSLYDEVGGFEESYRYGQGYDDSDLLWKLHAAGAEFVIRDDLICDHVECERCSWPDGGAAVNREIFNRRWPDHRHVLKGDAA